MIARLLGDIAWRLLGIGRSGGGRAVGVLMVWRLVDHVATRIGRFHDVRQDGGLRYRLRRHRGRTVTLRDGTLVARRARLVELHLANDRLQASLSEGSWSPWRWLESARLDLEVLAASSRNGELGAFAAVHGLTLLHPGARHLGFDVRPLKPGFKASLERYYFVGLEAVMHPTGAARLERGRQRHWPAEIWLSRAELEQLGLPRKALDRMDRRAEVAQLGRALD